MNLQKMLFSFEGRIGRATYWLAILPLVVAVQLIAYAPLLLVSTASDEMPISFMIAIFAGQLIWMAGLWPMLALGSKRLHDRNKRGWWLAIFWVLPFLLFFGGFGHDFLSDPAVVAREGYFTTGLKMMYAGVAVAIWGILELGILPGTRGPNLFGPEPGQNLA